MDAQEILLAIGLGEDKDWEFKSARGGLPGSLWETYSAMANTDGGHIVLGIKPQGDSYVVVGMDDPAQVRRDFWNTVNNRGKVSANLLRDEDVSEREAEGKRLLMIRVPRATRHERPIYIGQNPLLGTFRRNYEGDYRCTEKEVGRMLADRSEEPADSQVLGSFRVEDLDEASIQQYRQRFSARAPAHPWLGEDLLGFLEKLGAWRKDRATGERGPTLAGLLMFGKAEALRDPLAVPEFHLDYRERLSDDPEVRWTDRLTPDGTWEANVFQFFARVMPRLTADLKVPFRLEPDLFRRDDTPVTVYRLPSEGASVRRDSTQIGVDSAQIGGDSTHKIEESPHEPPSAEELQWLKMVAAPAREHRKLPAKETQNIILRLCEGGYLTATELGELMGRNPQGLSGRFLRGMVRRGLLARKYPDQPNRPDQAYTTTKRGSTAS
ncbi:MAG TPA: RNA-binding domain-containing protein [Planctomycetota bacterium]|nr:RNA-binding domain-containing protein [Planctomycetota bacterium]